MKLIILTILGVLTLTACNLDDEATQQRLKERVGHEAEQTQQKEKEAREKIVEEMEVDLERRQRLYQSIKGEFLGETTIDAEKYIISAEFVPTVIPLDSSSRVRTPEEVSADIQRLALDVKVVVRDDATKALLVSCNTLAVKLDLDKGFASWLSESSSCNNFFALNISKDPAGSKQNIEEIKADSETMALQILSGELKGVPAVSLRMKPGNSSEIFTFTLKKVEL
jgi:hypothetical protein